MFLLLCLCLSGLGLLCSSQNVCLLVAFHIHISATLPGISVLLNIFLNIFLSSGSHNLHLWISMSVSQNLVLYSVLCVCTIIIFFSSELCLSGRHEPFNIPLGIPRAPRRPWHIGVSLIILYFNEGFSE